VTVFDGAMGTQLYEGGIPFYRCFDELCLSEPERVRAVHRSYVQAGAMVLETNTFGANHFRLREHTLEDRVREINRAAVALAREEAGTDVLVAGSVGPIGKPLAPLGVVTEEEAGAAFREQIEALLEGGVDLLLIETISDLAEMTVALKTARALTSIPILAQMTFTEEGKTIIGNKPAEIARRLEELGADVVGANCSVGPQGLLEVIEKMAKACRVPVSVQPNAGLPRMFGGRYLYLSSPEYFQEYARHFVEAGAAVVGGCCGTTPEHVRAIARAVRGLAPARRNGAASGGIVVEEIEAPPPQRETELTSFGRKLGRKFVVSVEFDPPRGLDLEKFMKGAFFLKGRGIDAINVADSPLARPRMTPLAVAHLLHQNTGVETIIHLSCRDRNVLALQSELMGAHALGIRNILAVTGDPVQAGDYPAATDVFDVDSIGLCRIIRRLNEGLDLTGKAVDRPTDFLIGVGVNPTAPDLDLEMARYADKVEAGARFAFTQPLYDLRALEVFRNRAKPFGVPICVGILPLRNFKHSEFLHNEVPGMFVPDAIRERMRRAGEEGAREGVAIAREFLRVAKDMVEGTYLMPPFNRFEMAAEVIEVLGDRG
jgi:homocysteine S-methyltransferase